MRGGERPHCGLAGYRPEPDEYAIRNPFLREVMDLVGDAMRSGRDPAVCLREERASLVERFAFSVPTIGVLRRVAACSPIVELGAGSGYWAMCLSECGAVVDAFDISPPGDGNPWDIAAANRWFRDEWYPVEQGDETTGSLYPERSLLLCWPPPDSPMAFRALSRYLEAGGERAVFIGDAGASGDPSFHGLLTSLRSDVRMRIPGWPGLDEELVICRR
ncbi:MAG: class I SAM-dependent methyltransferase [Spirochaetes bacterium]|nr:class I SAM-dependent methyltransferase [Spirochaetota bacterium]